MPLDDILALEASLLNLAITCYPEQLDYVDEVFKFCGEVLEEKKYVLSHSSSIHSNHYLSYSSSMQLLYIYLFIHAYVFLCFSILSGLIKRNHPLSNKSSVC